MIGKDQEQTNRINAIKDWKIFYVGNPPIVASFMENYFPMPLVSASLNNP